MGNQSAQARHSTAVQAPSPTEVHLAELAPDGRHGVVDAELHLLADELLAQKLAAVERERLVLVRVVAPGLRLYRGSFVGGFDSFRC